MAVGAYAFSLPLLLWMSPVIVGLMLAIPLGLLTSGQPAINALFATPEDRECPHVLRRALELAASAPRKQQGALNELRRNSDLHGRHLRSIGQPAKRKQGQINVPLAIAREKIEDSLSFEEAVGFLDRQETLAVLNHAAALERILQLPDGRHRREAT